MKIGQLMNGTMLRLMLYGVIVQLENGTVGLVHISEVADGFVKDLSQHCSQGAPVMVRVLRQRADGRWEFSIRQAPDEQPAESQPDANTSEADQLGHEAATSPQESPNAARRAAKREAFNEKLRDYLSDSSECIEDVCRHHDQRRGGKCR